MVRKQIKKIAKRKGLSINQIIDKIGFTKSAYYQLNNPSLNRLLTIAQSLQCDVHELLPISEEFEHIYTGSQWIGIKMKER